MDKTKIKIKKKCRNCNKIFKRFLWRQEYYDKQNRKNAFCSRRCVYKYQKGKTNFSYKCGITTHDGYLIYSYGEYKGRLVHRIVMEKYLGRKLKKSEHIHHLDGNRKNNKINNLYLCIGNSDHMKRFHTSKKHKGFISGDNIRQANCRSQRNIGVRQ